MQEPVRLKTEKEKKNMSTPQNADAKEKEEQVPIIAAYGKNGMLKIKSALDMDDKGENYGKVIFSFVSLVDSSKYVDCYMDVNEFNLFMEKIHNGTIRGILAAGKAYTSNYGGRTEEGGPISRYFTIGKSTVADYFFTGQKYPAEKTDKGAFKPKKDAKALVQIQVPISQEVFDLKYDVWKTLYRKYLDRVITLDRFKDPYKAQQSQQ